MTIDSRPLLSENGHSDEAPPRYGIMTVLILASLIGCFLYADFFMGSTLDTLPDDDFRELQPWPQRLLLIRHGQAESNLASTVRPGDNGKRGKEWLRLHNIRDPLLTHTGIDQAKHLHTVTHTFLPPEIIIVSPLARTIETAYYGISKAWNSTLLVLMSDVREVQSTYSRKQNLFLKSTWGHPTSQWNESLPHDVFEWISQKPFHGFQSAEAESQWNESESNFTLASIQTVYTLQKVNKFWNWLLSLNSSRIAIITHKHYIHGFLDAR